MSTPIRITGVALAMLASACSTSTRSAGTMPVPSRGETEQQVAFVTASGNALRMGIDARDSALVARVLSPGVELVTFDGDTIRGRTPAMHFLVTAGVAGGEAFRLFAGTIVPCRDRGIEEIGATYNAPARADAPGAFRQGTAAIMWSVDGAEASAERVDLSVRRSSSYRAQCIPLHVTTARQQRLTATLAIDATPSGQSQAVTAVADGMPERGFDYRPVVQGWQPAPFPRVKAAIVGVSAGLRYRLRPAWSTELQAGVRAPSTVEGMNAVERRHVVVKTTPITMSTLLQFQRGVVRVSAGPALLLQNFGVTETHERIYYVGSQSNWEVISDSTHSAREISPAIGVASEVAVTLPMARRSLAELRVGFAQYGSSPVPATPHFREMTVSNRLLTAAISVGVGW